MFQRKMFHLLTVFFGDSGRCRSVFRGIAITDSGMMAITRSGMIPIS